MVETLQERRQHDKECGERLIRTELTIKGWVSDQICLCKKEIMGEVKTTKGRVALIIILLATTCGLSGFSVLRSFADAPHTHSSTDIEDAKQQQRIEHLEEQDIHFEKEHEKIDTKLEAMNQNIIKLLIKEGLTPVAPK